MQNSNDTNDSNTVHEVSTTFSHTEATTLSRHLICAVCIE